jgi:hypothetical protein
MTGAPIGVRTDPIVHTVASGPTVPIVPIDRNARRVPPAADDGDRGGLI